MQVGYRRILHAVRAGEFATVRIAPLVRVEMPDPEMRGTGPLLPARDRWGRVRVNVSTASIEVWLGIIAIVVIVQLACVIEDLGEILSLMREMHPYD